MLLSNTTNILQTVNKQKINFYIYLEQYQQSLYSFLDFQFLIFLEIINSMIKLFQDNLIMPLF